MSDEARGQWLTTTQAGAALGISARAVQKRCAAGTLAARRVQIPGGFKWEVDAREVEDGTPEPSRADPRKLEAGTGEIHPQEAQNIGPTLGTKTPELEGGASELRSERETEMKAEISFLRNLIEARDRDAVELRQALKRALDLAPKQLAAGAVPDSPQRATIASAGDNSHADANSTQMPAKRDGAPLTYGDIADELERKLNR